MWWWAESRLQLMDEELGRFWAQYRIFFFHQLYLAQFWDVFHFQMCIIFTFIVVLGLSFLFAQIIDKKVLRGFEITIYLQQNFLVFWSTWSYVQPAVPRGFLYLPVWLAYLLCINIKLCENFAVEFIRYMLLQQSANFDLVFSLLINTYRMEIKRLNLAIIMQSQNLNS